MRQGKAAPPQGKAVMHHRTPFPSGQSCLERFLLSPTLLGVFVALITAPQPVSSPGPEEPRTRLSSCMARRES